MTKSYFMFAGTFAAIVILAGGGYLIWDHYVDGQGAGAGETANLLAVIPLDENVSAGKTINQKTSAVQKVLVPASLQTDDLQKEISNLPANQTTTNPVIDPATADSEPVDSPTPVAQTCGFTANQSPARQNVFINEVAWMGSASNSSDEWIELKNTSANSVNLAGWQLVDMGEQIKIAIGDGVTIPASGFYLLERTDDNSVPGVTADQVYVGALANVGEGLRLFNKNCELIDEVLAAPDWPAGDNSFKKTMERSGSFTWHTYEGSGSSGILGTPRAENSAGPPPTTNETPPSNNDVSPNNTTPPPSSPPPPPPPPPAPAPAKILISEIQVGTTAGGTEDEFIELYNAGDQAVDLAGWALKKKTSSGTLYNLVSASAFTGRIEPKRFFLVAHVNYQGSKIKDLVYSANSNNLAYTNNSLVLYDASGVVADEVSWAEIIKDQSIERRALQNSVCVSAQNSGELLGNGCDTDAAGDFEPRLNPLPQNTQDGAEP